MRVYGGCIEPGGMDLDDETSSGPCPTCQDPNAHHWCFQRCESGSINSYSGWSCEACGDSDGDDGEP